MSDPVDNPVKNPVDNPAKGDRPPPQRSAKSDPATWVDRYGDALYGFAVARLRDRELAEEAVQEAFLGALESRSRFEGRSSERTWLFAILKRKVVDALRRRSRERPLGAEDLTDGWIDSFFQKGGHWSQKPGSWAPDPTSLREADEFWGVFFECLEGVPERAAQAFASRVMDGVDVDEICKVLQVSSNHLYVLLHRARALLRQCLEVNWFQIPKDGAR